MCLKNELFVVSIFSINPNDGDSNFYCETKKEAVEIFWEQVRAEARLRAHGDCDLGEIKAWNETTGRTILHINFAQFYEWGHC